MDKTFTFMYENQRYITTQPVPALKSKYSYTNAIPVANVDWNIQLEYITCGKSLIPCKNIEDIPVLENAIVSKEGDIFTVSGTVRSADVVYNITMNADGINVTESISEQSSTNTTDTSSDESYDVSDNAEITIPPASTISVDSKVHLGIPLRTPRMTFKQPSHTVHRVDVPTEASQASAPVQMLCEPITVESVKHTSFTKDEIFILADHFTTLARLYQPAAVETVVTRDSQPPVQSVQVSPGLSFGQTPLPNLSASSPGVIPVTPIQTKEAPTTKEVPATEMSSYSEILSTIPIQLLTNCSAYTATRVNKDEVVAGGAVYCTTSGWSHEGDWYAIDEVATVTRHFLDACSEKYYAIPLADIKAWINVNC